MLCFCDTIYCEHCHLPLTFDKLTIWQNVFFGELDGCQDILGVDAINDVKAITDVAWRSFGNGGQSHSPAPYVVTRFFQD